MGSRATASHAQPSPFQDYDVAVVLPAPAVPLAMPRLKKIAAEVEAQYGAQVSLNPLPAFRLRFCGANYMLLKLGREGEVLHGQDLLQRARGISPSSIGPWWYFFFLASQARRLLLAYPAGHSTDQVAYAAAKALLGCAELLVLRSGVYDSRPAFLHQALLTLGRGDVAAEVEQAIAVLEGRSGQQAAVPLWWMARARLLATLHQLSFDFLGVAPSDRQGLARAFLRSGGRRRLARDLQFAALLALARRPVPPRAFLDRRGVPERVKLALFWLLGACAAEEGPDAALLGAVRQTLSGVLPLERTALGWDEWAGLLRAVESYYPFACVALGV